jgi:hypothetical protein
MDSLKPQLPKISNEDRTPLVDVLLELLAWQQIQIDKLEQEILKLKGETTKPKIKPSKMDEDSAVDGAMMAASLKRTKGRNAVKLIILRLMPRSTSTPIIFQKVQPLRVIGTWSFKILNLRPSILASA